MSVIHSKLLRFTHWQTYRHNIGDTITFLRSGSCRWWDFRSGKLYAHYIFYKKFLLQSNWRIVWTFDHRLRHENQCDCPIWHMRYFCCIHMLTAESLAASMTFTLIHFFEPRTRHLTPAGNITQANFNLYLVEHHISVRGQMYCTKINHLQILRLISWRWKILSLSSLIYINYQSGCQKYAFKQEESWMPRTRWSVFLWPYNHC